MSHKSNLSCYPQYGCPFLNSKTMFESFASKVLYEILSAVGYIHGKNIVHRDIKVDNILLSFEGNLHNCINFNPTIR